MTVTHVPLFSQGSSSQDKLCQNVELSDSLLVVDSLAISSSTTLLEISSNLFIFDTLLLRF